MRRFKYCKGGDKSLELESKEGSWIVEQVLGENAKKKTLEGGTYYE
jgi:hypothetical protein